MESRGFYFLQFFLTVYLFHGHARVEEHGKVSEFVRELFAEDGQADADPGQGGLREGGPDAQAVDEVVDAVAKDDHPGHGGDRRLGTVARGTYQTSATYILVL